MSPLASQMLLERILPLLSRTIPHTVMPANGEDSAELIQDGVAIAADMLENDEKAGRQPLPASIAYYSIQRLKTGRRSYSSSTVDVLSPHAQMTQGFTVSSLDASAADVGDDGDDDATLGDLLACRRDDPASEAARSLDWKEFMAGCTDRQQLILTAIATGDSQKSVATALNVSAPRVCQLRDGLAYDIREHFGEMILAEAMEQPVWRHDMNAKAEKAAARMGKG